jgi:uncharacterized protein (TIGR02996 family)
VTGVSIQQAFLAAIAESPEDDAPRLVYADWLREQDDPALAARGEFIALQCRLIHEQGEARKRTKQLARAISREHRAAWLGAASAFCECEFTRGFVERATLSSADLGPPQHYLDAVRELFRREPLVRSLSLNRVGTLSAEVLKDPDIPRLSFLTLWEEETTLRRSLEVIAAAPRLLRLKWLNVKAPNLTRDDAQPLFEAPALDGLRRLILYSRNFAADDEARLRERFGDRLHVFRWIY